MITWLIDEVLSERQYECGFPTLAEAAKEAGHEVVITKYIPFSTEPSVPEHPIFNTNPGPYHCVVTHGTIQFCRQMEKHFGRNWCPGMYFNANVKSFEKFAVRLGDDLLSSEYCILPWGEITKRKRTNVFVKPLSGLKEFTGQVIKDRDYNISPHSPIEPDTLCVMAIPKAIKAEFRYVIADRKVITGSEYRWDDVLDVRADTLPLCDAMAEKVATAEWQADTVYVCDVALTQDMETGEDVAKVIELNAFSSSGLYACDTRKIVDAVSRAAQKEFIGEV